MNFKMENALEALFLSENAQKLHKQTHILTTKKKQKKRKK